MARMMRAKRKLAEREAQPATTHSEDTPVKPSATPHEQPGSYIECVKTRQ